MFEREITSFGKTNLAKLREFKKVKSIKQLRIKYPNKSDDAIYLQIASEYNNTIDNIKAQKLKAKRELQESIRTSKKESREHIKSINSLPVNVTTQKSREERLLSNTNRVKATKNLSVKEKKRYNRKALNGAYEDDEYTDLEENFSTNDLYDLIYRAIMEKLVKTDLRQNNLNVNIFIQFLMEKNGTDSSLPFGYNSEFVEKVISPNQISQWIKEEITKFQNYIENLGASDLLIKQFDKVNVQFSMTKKVRGGSYIELPNAIKLSHACVNIKNDDNECIRWALLASKYYEKLTRKDKNMVGCYKTYKDEIKFPDKIDFPINIHKDIPKIEELNNLKINVFRLDGQKLQVFYNSRERNNNVVNLLLLESDTNNHFVWIKDLSKLMFKHNKNHHKVHICSQCLAATFDSAQKLEQHYDICFKHEAVRCVLPKEGKNIVKFKNYGNMFPHPFSVFMDFESTLEKVTDDTNAYQKHICNSVGYKYNCIYDEYSEPLKIINSSNPEELLENLINDLERLAIKSYELTKQNEKYNGEKVKGNSTCEYCNIKFSNECKPCLHHDHISGKYIATICSECNLQYTYKKFLPVYIHNLKGYDSHFIVPMLSKYGFQGDISCIPNNEERYISFSKKISVGSYQKDGKEHKVFYEIRFLDSLAFMASSLENLADNLKNSCKNIDDLRNTFKNVSNHFKDDEQFTLMIEKGVYPYEYIDSFNKLSETSLPFIDKFYSKLNGSTISYKDYLRANFVWKKFNCKTILDYHNLYLSSDVLLLADIWENFKKVCMKIYKLDVSYYYTAPGLSWDAFLKHTQEEYISKHNKDFEIELLTDMDMYLLVENNIRGGLSQISKRYAKANNKGMKGYNKNAIDEYILYLDANNLYGYAMCKYLPQKDFKWNTDEWSDDKILLLDDEGNTGYLFDVDLEYPDILHDLHNGYALAPENMEVKNNMLNSFQIEGRKETKIKKLITSFYEKKNYGINYRLLKLYLQLGIKIKKVNRVLQYTQNNFMESYIMKNTNERKSAKNDFEKDFYKLMNNSVYGKTMENVRNRINFNLVCNENKALGLRNIIKKRTIFNEDCVGVHQLKTEVVLNKPIFIGQCVLDQSKYLMNDFHYNFMLKQFDRENIDLLFTDTDSLCYHIRKQNPYEIIAQNKDLFDLSAYPKDHPLYDPTNKKVIGKFKDEAVDGVMAHITEFVGLRSKLYSYTTEENHVTEEHHKCKGVKHSVVHNELKTQLYKSTLFSRQCFKVKQNGFRSHKHQIYTEEIEKVALSAMDDKVYIEDNNIHTKTLGHYKIRRD